MSAAINLTEGEEFLRPSANFWSGGKELEKSYCVQYSVQLHTRMIFSSH